MDFGKLAHIGRVDFRLPELGGEADRRSLGVLARARMDRARATACAIRVGCPVWAERAWLGRVYPLGAKPSAYLREYSRQFGMIELNTTHYRIPTPEAVTAWREQTPDDFRFCPKWPKAVSHHHQLVGCEPLTGMFCDSISRLDTRLGTTFLQLPPEFSPQRLPALARFLSQLPRGFPICVEFRHASWFTHEHSLIPAALDLLERFGAGTVITEVAGRRDVAHLSITAPRVLMRFVGNLLDPTDTSRIDEWVPRLAAWRKGGLHELYFCAHQADNVLAPELAAIFVERMSKLAGTELRPWKTQDQGQQLGFGEGF